MMHMKRKLQYSVVEQAQQEISEHILVHLINRQMELLLVIISNVLLIKMVQKHIVLLTKLLLEERLTLQIQAAILLHQKAMVLIIKMLS